jgi:hypothetical protein
MAPIALALVLFLQAQPAAAADAAPPPSADSAPAERWPAGAPREDYPFVAWCYGSLRGYLDLHDQVMPEVTRIESTYRPPGRKLSDDLRVYADMQKDGRVQLKLFQGALTAAEKASLRPINAAGAAAVQKGMSTWRGGPDVTPARLAQAWMSWALPAKCAVTAKSLEARATLAGATFKVNAEPEAPSADAAPSPSDVLLRPSDSAPAPAESSPPK